MCMDIYIYIHICISINIGLTRTQETDLLSPRVNPKGLALSPLRQTFSAAAHNSQQSPFLTHRASNSTTRATAPRASSRSSLFTWMLIRGHTPGRGRWHAPSSRQLRALFSVCGRYSCGSLGCCSCRVRVFWCRGCCSLSVRVCVVWHVDLFTILRLTTLCPSFTERATQRRGLRHLGHRATLRQSRRDAIPGWAHNYAFMCVFVCISG